MPGATWSAYLPWLSDLAAATTSPDTDTTWTVVSKGRSGQGQPACSTGQVGPAITDPVTVPLLVAGSFPQLRRSAPPVASAAVAHRTLDDMAWLMMTPDARRRALGGHRSSAGLGGRLALDTSLALVGAPTQSPAGYHPASRCRLAFASQASLHLAGAAIEALCRQIAAGHGPEGMRAVCAPVCRVAHRARGRWRPHGAGRGGGHLSRGVRGTHRGPHAAQALPAAA